MRITCKHGIQYETKHRVFTCVVRLSISLITVFESPKVFATSSIFVRAFYKQYTNYNTYDQWRYYKDNKKKFNIYEQLLNNY